MFHSTATMAIYGVVRTGIPQPIGHVVGDDPQPKPASTSTALSLLIRTVEGEPRILDLDLAKALGMSKPENIRQTIDANREELERFGVITFSVITSGPKGGATGTAYYLNDDQATYVAMQSAAPPGSSSQARNPHPLLNGQSCGNTKTPALKRTNIVIRS